MAEHEELIGEVIAETDQAILVLLDESEYASADEDGIWIPRSVCAEGDALSTGDTNPDVADWWLRDRGLAD